jgi:hypothetical protein
MLASIVSHIPADPITLAVLTGILIILGLVCHAYFDTRPRLIEPQTYMQAKTVGPKLKTPDNKPAELPKGPSVRTPGPDTHESTGMAHGGSPLRVEYVTDGLQGKLIVKTRGKPLRVLNFGDLVCEEIYSNNYEPIPLSHAFREIDQGTSLECQIAGFQNRETRTSMPLDSVLDLGSLMTRASLSVEYEIEGRKQSTLFFIYRNIDGSIVWLTDEPKTHPQDLAAMHHRIALLDTARKDLPVSGVVQFLAEESRFIAAHLRKILEENDMFSSKMDLSRPMKREIIYLGNETDETPLPWQRRRLMVFADRYGRLIDRCQIRGLPTPAAIPTGLEAEPFLGRLDAHATALELRARSIAAPFDPPTPQFSA